jgi:hypothetical protein
MNKAVRYYITGSGEKAVVRSVPVAIRTESVEEFRLASETKSNTRNNASTKRSRLKARLGTTRRAQHQDA